MTVTGTTGTTGIKYAPEEIPTNNFHGRGRERAEGLSGVIGPGSAGSPGLTPNEDQQRAIKTVHAWLASGSSRPFVLGGLAGTGKTSLLGMLDLPDSTRYVAPTWKAAKVLEGKLAGPAVTSIHNLLYGKGEILHKRECEATRCTLGCKELVWSFDPKEQPGLLVVDEASMVGESLRRDIERLGVPVLYVGDVGQLPPINDGLSIFAARGCDVELKTIQRQSEGSPVIALSRVARSGDPEWLEVADMLDVPVVSPRDRPYSAADGDPGTVFIAGTNKAVDLINGKVRRALGHGPEPLVNGDRVMLQNNLHEQGLFNGQQGTVHQMDLYCLGPRWAQLRMETGVSYTGPVLVRGVDKIPDWPKVPVVRHSYAVTCHKAQGSEYDHVVVYVEGSRPEMSRGWLYTAITRARTNLTFLLPSSQLRSST